MELEFIKSSTVLVRDGTTEVLCDPWLIDGAYYGSWAHYPPVEFDPATYDNADFIYVSHIHPDHVHEETFDRIDDDIPVLIHDFQFDYLKDTIERMGFEVIELPHDSRTHLAGDLYINILAADNCDPEMCGSFFGCDWLDNTEDGHGSSGIDTMAVFDNGERTLVNINDCPFELSRPAAERILNRYDEVDHLLVNYTGAGPYPQCFENLSEREKEREARAKRQSFYKQAENYINLFEPAYYTPFAGTYILAGKLAELNEYRGVATRHEVGKYLRRSANVDSEEHECVLLNSQSTFDIDAGKVSDPFTPVDRDWLRQYVQTELAGREYPYESVGSPTIEQLEGYVPEAYERMEEKRRQIGFESETDVVIDLRDGHCVRLSMQGNGFEFLSEQQATAREPYVKYDVDPRLLEWILQGPQYAHWNNAEIGSHIAFDRQPNTYERGLYYSMNFFHA